MYAPGKRLTVCPGARRPVESRANPGRRVSGCACTAAHVWERVFAGVDSMSELDTNRIEVPVESDGVVYVFEGSDAEERHQDWALTGAATFDRIEPRA